MMPMKDGHYAVRSCATTTGSRCDGGGQELDVPGTLWVGSGTGLGRITPSGAILEVTNLLNGIDK